MNINNQLLAAIIEMCFDYAMDDRVSESSRKDFSAIGKRLRGALLNLITAEFEAESAQFRVANKEIAAVNRGLQEEAQVLENVAATIEQLGKLAAILDELLKVAVSFV